MSEEYFDVLDESGQPTGERKLRSEVHAHGDWHKAVHIWLVNSKGDLLVQKRSPTKDSHPNMWDISAAGHLGAGETSIEGALREIREELGINVKAKDLMFLGSVSQQKVLNNGTFINNEFNDVYLLQKDISIDQITIDNDEVVEVKFIHHKSLRKQIEEDAIDFVSHPDEEALLFEYLDKYFKWG